MSYFLFDVHDSSLTDLFFSVRGVFFIPINSSDKIATKVSVMISGSEVLKYEMVFTDTRRSQKNRFNRKI